MAGNQFINTFARQVMRSAVQIAMAFGIKKGIDLLANRGKDPAQRLCCTNRVRDSSRESSVLVANHEQTDTPRLQDPQLAGL